MATRAATFTAKIRNLKDYHYRLLNNVSPLPTGVDVANTLKYFSQTLLSVLKDIPLIPSEGYKVRQSDSVRLAVFPNLHYSGLYDAVLSFIDIVPIVDQGQHALGESILAVIGWLVPFIEFDLLDTLPHIVASTLAIFPSSLHVETIELLCLKLLPLTLGYAGSNDNPTYGTDSTAAIIMLVFQYIDDGAQHSRLLECIMSMKRNVFKDLLSVIAHGPACSRPVAVHHLFHYWPQLNPARNDRRGIHSKYLGFSHQAWQCPPCQQEDCPNNGCSKSVKMCLDATISIQCGDRPPPLYVCGDCSDLLAMAHAHTYFLVDLLKPLEKMSVTCENKNCISAKNTAVCTCFSLECAGLNGFRPIRYCAQCHDIKHTSGQGTEHMYHLTINNIWDCQPDTQTYLAEAIVSLLKEAAPLEDKRIVEMGDQVYRHYDDSADSDAILLDERKLLSRYGIWLMVELAVPREQLPIEILGRLLAMLFQWFDATAYLPDDSVGNALERLKPDYISHWLEAIARTHVEVILSCLLPHPVDYARVGGYWDALSSRTIQIKEGLNRMFCLVPYNIVTYEVWDYVVPFWLEAIRTEVPEEERSELKVLMCKMFDTDMSPLPFNVDKMYHFMEERFEGTSAAVQEQNLEWLQIISSLNIIVPMDVLIRMFNKGISSLGSAVSSSHVVASSIHAPIDDIASPLTPPIDNTNTAFPFDTQDIPTEQVSNMQCLVMMLDIIISQLTVQELCAHVGIFTELSNSILQLLTSALSLSCDITHTCDSDQIQCNACEFLSLSYQLTANIMEFIVPKEELRVPVRALPKVEEIRMLSESKDPETGSINSSGDAVPHFDSSKLPAYIQLLNALLHELDKQTDADALFFLMQTTKLLCLHGKCLNYALRDYQPYVKHCLQHLLIPNLWKSLQSEHSQIGTLCVPLLLHTITLANGAAILWQKIECDFNHSDWRCRFSAVEKVTVLARLMNTEHIKDNHVIITSLAHAFCHLIGSLNDMNSSVVIRAVLFLETIKESTIKCMCYCLEFQFDSVITDRTLVLQRLLLLQASLPKVTVFSWEFFLNRFDTLCLEAQLDLESTGEVNSFTDLTSSDRQSEHFLKKLNRARFALARTDSIRSVSGSLLNKPPYRRATSIPIHLQGKSMSKEKDKAYTRQQSAPQFGRRDTRGSRLGSVMFSNYAFPGGNLREFTDEESNFAALLHKAMDLQGVDRETVHLLVSLLMKFMNGSDQCSTTDDKNMSQAQNIVLRHLNVLLGYNQTEKSFSVPPYKLRYSSVFNAFLSALPQVLDSNFSLGNIMLPVAMMLLQYCPSPQRYASDYQPPNYTLTLLEPHCRIAWLKALLVILYKYQYNAAHVSSTIQTLIQLVINMIDSQIHRCKTSDDAIGPASPVIPRNRDTSNVSVGDMEMIQETDTPPQSDSDSERDDIVTFSLNSSTRTSYTRDKQIEYSRAPERRDRSAAYRRLLNKEEMSPPTRTIRERNVFETEEKTEETELDSTSKLLSPTDDELASPLPTDEQLHKVPVFVSSDIDHTDVIAPQSLMATSVNTEEAAIGHGLDDDLKKPLIKDDHATRDETQEPQNDGSSAFHTLRNVKDISRQRSIDSSCALLRQSSRDSTPTEPFQTTKLPTTRNHYMMKQQSLDTSCPAKVKPVKSLHSTPELYALANQSDENLLSSDLLETHFQTVMEQGNVVKDNVPVSDLRRIQKKCKSDNNVKVICNGPKSLTLSDGNVDKLDLGAYRKNSSISNIENSEAIVPEEENMNSHINGKTIDTQAEQLSSIEYVEKEQSLPVDEKLHRKCALQAYEKLENDCNSDIEHSDFDHEHQGSHDNHGNQYTKLMNEACDELQETTINDNQSKNKTDSPSNDTPMETVSDTSTIVENESNAHGSKVSLQSQVKVNHHKNQRVFRTSRSTSDIHYNQSNSATYNCIDDNINKRRSLDITTTDEYSSLIVHSDNDCPDSTNTSLEHGNQSNLDLKNTLEQACLTEESVEDTDVCHEFVDVHDPQTKVIPSQYDDTLDKEDWRQNIIQQNLNYEQQMLEAIEHEPLLYENEDMNQSCDDELADDKPKLIQQISVASDINVEEKMAQQLNEFETELTTQLTACDASSVHDKSSMSSSNDDFSSMVMRLENVHIKENNDEPSFDDIAGNNNNTNNTNSQSLESQDETYNVPTTYVSETVNVKRLDDSVSSESDHNEFSSESIGEYVLSSGDKPGDTDCSNNSSGDKDEKERKDDRNKNIAISDKKKKSKLCKMASTSLVEEFIQPCRGSVFRKARTTNERAKCEKAASMCDESATQFYNRTMTDLRPVESELDESPCPSPPNVIQRTRPNFRQRKSRKGGVSSDELHRMLPELSEIDSKTTRYESRWSRKSEISNTSMSLSAPKKSLSSCRFSDVSASTIDRCMMCNSQLEQCDESTMSLAIVCLGTFIHREPALATPMLLDMLQTVARIAASNPYPWQAEISGLIIPGNCVSVARGFLRCVLHQLAPNGIFLQLFLTQLEDPEFLKTIASALLDFPELNCYVALQLIIEGVNDMRMITPEQMSQIMTNLNHYLSYISVEATSPHWTNILVQFETFFRRLLTVMTSPSDFTAVFKVMVAVLKIPNINSVKTILEPFSKLLSFAIQNCTFKLKELLEIAALCNRTFIKERDKLYLSRCIVFELMQALKFKVNVPDENLLLLVQFVCLDAGGTLGSISFVSELSTSVYTPYSQGLTSTNGSDCMRQHLTECVEFVADHHTITKIKSNTSGTTQNLNEDTLGSHLKCGIAQFIALEFSRGRDNRLLLRYLPWLNNPPTSMQQGPREFLESVSHIRFLSWLLLGALTHTVITKGASNITCQPIPLEASGHIADFIMLVFTGFAEQSKVSVLHMSSLFHAFILCQLWTMYCESYAANSTPYSDCFTQAHSTNMDFWGKVTPGVLQLHSHSKMIAEMVNLHFLSLMEALQECNSTVLTRMFPMWTQILFCYKNNLPGHMRVRLQMVLNSVPREQSCDSGSMDNSLDSDTMHGWLQRIQFKLSQIEVQSSTAAQFYSV